MDRAPSRRESSSSGLGATQPPSSMRPATPSRQGLLGQQGAPLPMGYRAPGTSSSTGSFGPPPRTGRPLNSRAGGRPATPGSVGLNTEVQVADRPVTQQGMTGMRTGTQGPGRQIADKTYYLSLLRTKKQQLQAEIESMAAEMERYQKDDTTSTQLNRKHELLLRDVKGLRGQLADYNLVLDKAGSEFQLEAIKAEHKALKDRNDRERKKIDNLFTERTKKEASIREAEAEAAQIQRAMEQRLNELAPDKRTQYAELQAESRALAGAQGQLEEELAQLTSTLAQLEQEAMGSSLKARALALQEQLAVAEQKRRDALAEEAQPILSPEEQREQMIQKMRRDNADVKRAEEGAQEAEEAMRRAEVQLEQVNADLAENSGEKSEKYLELQQKDREMQAFIDSFDSEKAERLRLTAETQQSIVQLLERISRGMEIAAALPSKGQFKEMQDELKYKQQQMEASQTTHQRLQEELALRRAELDKMGTLEDKIAEELRQLAAKSAAMRADLDKFTRINEVQSSWEAKRKELEAVRAASDEKRESLRAKVQQASASLEARRAVLVTNEHWAVVDRMEQKMQQLDHTINQMQSYIDSKSKETDYKPILAEVTNLVHVLNVEVQKAALAP